MSKEAQIPFHVLIPAAGSGTRTGAGIPKQYKKVAGKALLRHTIEKFVSIQGLKTLRVIIDPSHILLYKEAVEGLDLPPPVMGAATRKQSVYNGIASFKANEQDDLVLIHDAARPFVSEDSIKTLLTEMQKSPAATLATPVADTLVDAEYKVVDRDAVNAVQTPQAFKISLLKRAHEQFRNDDKFTDDAGLVAAIGEPIKLVAGSRENFKVTTPEDMVMAEKILTAARETRTGFGYDVHTFDPAPAEKIRLGGIDIPYSKKLLGHSDADVILHALTDALLGTIGEGDIGQLFPPSDAKWKNADSAIFITEAVKRVKASGGQIIHADITLIAEEPKIGPHREKMIARIAELLGIAPNRVGLKATTSEGLGFTGRKEGMVAQAVASVTLPV